MAAIDQDKELDAAGAAMIEEGVESGADGAACVEHIVDQDDVASVDIEAEGAGNDNGANVARGEIVTIEADVEDAGIDWVLLNGADECAETLRDGDTAALDADEADGFCAVVLFDDLVRETNEGALDFGGGHDPSLLAQFGRSNSLQI